MRSDVEHFRCEIEGGIARIALDRPERKNPLTFESYAELRDWFRDLHYADDVHEPFDHFKCDGFLWRQPGPVRRRS